MKIERNLFLTQRAKELAAFKRQCPNAIVCDAGDEIICDVCNDEILTELILIDEGYALCDDCQKGRAAI